MMRVSIDGITLWAARDLLRRPGEHVMIGLCFMVTAAALAVALLLSQAVSDTAAHILSASPSLVVRRVNAGGWAPIPVTEAVAKVRALAGVVSVRPRLWGAIRTDTGPVTVVGVQSTTDVPMFPRPLRPGEAWVGPGVEAGGARLFLGANRRDFSIAGRLPPETGMVAHDLVLLDWTEAGAVLGIASGFASDLAVEVFHPQEADALTPELVRAMPWPVVVTTRTDAVKAYSGSVLRRGSLAALALFPALLALMLLVVQAMRDRLLRKEEIGLLRALGWETSHLVRLHLTRAGLVAVPALLAGMLIGYGLVFGSSVSWPSKLLLGWSGSAPHLTLDPAGSLQTLAVICAMLLLPYFFAAAAPVLWAALADPQDLLEKGR